MSDIHDPAQPDSPTAPGDEGNSSQPAEPGNALAPAGEPGNARDDAPARAESDEQPQPAAPGNERSGAGAQAQHDEDEDDGPAPGNEAPGAARASGAGGDEDESPEDSIGNRLDRPPTHNTNLGQLAAQQGAGAGGGKRRDKRNKHKGAGQGQQAQGGGPGNERGPRPGGGGNQKDVDPNARRAFHVGDKVRAKVVSLGAAGAIVDLWGKEHGVLDLREITTPENPEPKAGDAVDVVVVQDGSRGGNVVVTRDPSRADRAREMVAQAFNNNEPIEGLVTGVNRGGLEVDLSGVRAFCPSSQIDVRFPPTVNPKTLVLTRQLFKITSLVEETKEAIVSRRSLLEADARARAEEARANIKVGQVVKGTVVAIKDYGVFVDLGGIEGLIHISELTHNRSARPSDVVKVGEEVEAKVLRISGGGPKPEPNAPPASAAGEKGGAEAAAGETAPGEDAHADEAQQAEAAGDAASGEDAHGDDAAAAPGEEAGGEAAGAQAAGAAPGKDGDRKGAGKDGDKKGGKKARHKGGRGVEGMPRVMLSRRAVEPDPWSGVEKKFPVGSVHSGKVARMQPFGAFIELSPGVDGLLHVSELGAGKRIEHPNEVLKEAQTVNVRVERVERGAKRISLSLVPEGVTEEQLKNAVVPRVGMVVKATIVEHDSLGVWAQIDGAIGKLGRGLIPPPESNQPRGTDLRKAIPIGTKVQVKVVEMDRGRLKLSIKAALHDEERQAYRAYQKEATSTRVGVSLADKLRGKLGGLAGGGPSSGS